MPKFILLEKIYKYLYEEFDTDRYYTIDEYFRNWLSYVCLCALHVANVWVLYTGLGLWCLTPFPTLFQLYRGVKSYWCRKSEYP